MGDGVTTCVSRAAVDAWFMYVAHAGSGDPSIGEGAEVCPPEGRGVLFEEV